MVRGIILRHQTRVGLPKTDGRYEYSWIHYKTSPAFSTPNPQETGAPTTLSRIVTIKNEGVVDRAKRQNTLTET